MKASSYISRSEASCRISPAPTGTKWQEERRGEETVWEDGQAGKRVLWMTKVEKHW